MHTSSRLAPFLGATTPLLAPIKRSAAILSVMLMTLAWAMPAAAAESAVEISIDNFTFTPATITIEPGKAPSPGPMAVPAGELTKYLGVTDVKFAKVNTPLAIMDATLAGT